MFSYRGIILYNVRKENESGVERFYQYTFNRYGGEYSSFDVRDILPFAHSSLPWNAQPRNILQYLIDEGILTKNGIDERPLGSSNWHQLHDLSPSFYDAFGWKKKTKSMEYRGVTVYPAAVSYKEYKKEDHWFQYGVREDSNTQVAGSSFDIRELLKDYQDKDPYKDSHRELLMFLIDKEIITADWRGQ